MRLGPQWKTVVKRAWSVWLMIAAAILSGLEVAIPFLEGVVPVRPGVFAAAAGLTTIAAFIARLMVQANLK